MLLLMQKMYSLRAQGWGGGYTQLEILMTPKPQYPCMECMVPRRIKLSTSDRKNAKRSNPIDNRYLE